MSEVGSLGKMLMVAGVLLLLVGALVAFVGKVPRLPGDILIRRDGFTLYIPIATSIVLSLVLTLLLSLLFTRR